MWKYSKFLVCGLGVVLLTAQPAAANAGPTLGPQVTFGVLALLLLLVVLSAAGGAYSILASLDPQRKRWWRIALRWVGAIAILLPTPGISEGWTAFSVVLPLLYVWLRRCIEMLWWARQARASTPRPPHLATATPWRLSLAGIALLALPVLAVYAMDPLEQDRVSREFRRIRFTYSDTKTAVVQAIVYANDKEVYPTSLAAMRSSGYANVQDTDPWKTPYVLAPVLREGRKLRDTDDVYVYSRGPCGAGTYDPTRWKKDAAGHLATGKCGAIGYSSIYGSFRGEP